MPTGHPGRWVARAHGAPRGVGVRGHHPRHSMALVLRTSTVMQVSQGTKGCSWRPLQTSKLMVGLG